MNTQLIPQILYILAILASTFLGQIIIYKILDVYYNKVAKKTKTRFDDEFIPLLKRILGIGIWIIGISRILMEFGINLLSLTTTLGIGVLVGTIIVKDSLTNILAGVTIMFDKPFRLGDKIRLPSGEAGTILKVGLRRTTLEIMDKKKKAHLILPNKDVSKCKIINYTYAKEAKNDRK